MKRFTAVAVSLCAAVAFAADSKEDAQKKVDEAMAKSCELSKKNVMDHKDVCAEAATALEPIDCANKDQRKSVDFLKLNVECAKKMKAGGAAKTEDKPADGAAAAPAEGGEKKKGSHCKVVDEAGAVVVEHDSEGTTIKCQGEIREKVKAASVSRGRSSRFSTWVSRSPAKRASRSA